MKKLLLFASLISLCLSSYAKIGENTMTLKGRLMARSGTCLMYNSMDEQYREILELPYKDLVMLMPKETNHMFFYKNADARSVSSVDTVTQSDLDGWEVHIVTYKNVSVMESYRRHPFMNPEELARLMQVLVKDRKDVTWIASSTFVQTAADEEEIDSIYDDSEQIMKHLASVLPKVKNKKIEIEIPKEYTSGNSFNESLARKIYTEAKTKAFDRKKAEVESDRERVLQATARKGTKQSSNSSSKKSSNASSSTSSEISGASSLDSVNLKIERDPDGTEVKFYTRIPSQEDTALGFNYISTDGALRAKIILASGNTPVGLLVVDTRFDKLMRDVMDSFYNKQSKERDDLAIQSVSAF